MAYDDYYKSPLSINEVAEAVVDLANSTYRGPIHVAGPRMNVYEFYQRAMATLRVDTAGLRPEPMPEIPGFMRDTSLNSSRWWTMRGEQPMSVKQALTSNLGSPKSLCKPHEATPYTDHSEIEAGTGNGALEPPMSTCRGNSENR